MTAGQSHLIRVPKFWPSICPERCAHMDKDHSEGGYPADFGILGAIIFHMRLPCL